MAKKEYRDKVVVKHRLVFVFCLLTLLLIVLVGRLADLMIRQSKWLQKLAVRQWTSDVVVSPKRGEILDTNLNELAVSANVYRVDLDMKTIRQDISKKKITEDEVADKLSSALGIEKDVIITDLHKTLPGGLPLSGITLKRRVEKDVADKVTALKIRGVLVSSDTKRYYVNNNLLSQVLGHTNSDGNGLTGLEKYYDSTLKGTSGKRIIEIDSRGQEIPNSISSFTKPKDGENLVTTVDEVIQNFCDNLANQALTDNKAKAVTIIVMNPNNGEVLAMVNKPDYNPNDPWGAGKTTDELNKVWRNRAISDTFEPGSIFKVITASAAMSEGTVNEQSKFNCSGSMNVDGRIIHCWKTAGHGAETFPQLLQNSCNVGFMQVGLTLGKERLNKYINLFGLGQKTGIDLPGEATGIVKATNKISNVDLATISFGQTDTLSCIQYLTAFNAVANGGNLITPHIMKELVHNDDEGNTVIDKKYELNPKRILSEDVTAKLRGYLEQVVSIGGGQNAYIEGYHIGGKTGTAKKIDPGTGRYGNGMYIASFCGMAPITSNGKPKVTVFVSIDQPDPSNYYAGQVSAPVAKQVFYDIFNYLAFTPDATGEQVAQSLLQNVVVPEVRGLKKNDAIEALRAQHLNCSVADSKGDSIVEIDPKPGSTVKEGTKITLYTGTSTNYNNVVIVPNLKGLSRDKAQDLLSKMGINAVFTGSGVVADQSLAAGTQIKKGSSITLDLEVLGD